VEQSGWFPHFSAGQGGARGGKKGYSANLSIYQGID